MASVSLSKIQKISIITFRTLLIEKRINLDEPFYQITVYVEHKKVKIPKVFMLQVLLQNGYQLQRENMFSDTQGKQVKIVWHVINVII